MKTLVILHLFFASLLSFGNNFNDSLRNYQSFKFEFKYFEENSKYEKKDGDWLLIPTGLGLVSAGVASIGAGVVYGILVGFILNDKGYTEKYLAGAGIVIGGVTIGSGLIFYGVKVFDKGRSDAKYSKSSKKGQQRSIQKFENY